jgi:hypothetical protein
MPSFQYILQIDLDPVSNDFCMYSMQPFTRKAPFRTVTKCSRVGENPRSNPFVAATYLSV